ncbi:uncharacterized protein LOC123264425 isoform X1 [Cotesia glomerata]|uniref:Uncharacterized protein n=2 Tax=Cotesia glomerata TaxID=32391 RepID=A0AAV7IQG7_COTGL|nr:uncharacterized protein LOC123264425 isoform X1 [Cotesia glomerata]KAH0555129.1 hypothetical protein KQX54_015433 [Cotesia glomerata]
MNIKIFTVICLPIYLPAIQSANIEEAAVELITCFEKLIANNNLLKENSLSTLKNIKELFFDKLKSYDRYKDSLFDENRLPQKFSDGKMTEQESADHDKFCDVLHGIDKMFNGDVERYLDNYKAYAEDIDSFIEEVSDYSFEQDLKFLVAAVSQNPGSGSFDEFNVTSLFLQSEVDIDDNCNKPPVYERLFKFYEKILMGVYQGYTAMFLAHEYQKIKGSGDGLRTEQKFLLTEFKNSVIRIIETGHYHLNLTDETYKRMYKNCDALEWSEGRNYIRVKNYVAYYEQRTKWYFDPNADYLDTKEPEYECSGIRANFNRLDLPQGIVYSMYCPIVFLENFNSEDTSCRKYGWNNVRGYKKENWTSACILGDHSELEKLCACDKQVDNDISVRLLSLREYYTNSSDNRVVTGIRFAVEKNVITLQIQEGHLVNGEIDPSSVKWRTDGGHPAGGPTQTVRLSYKIRGFNLDDIEIPDGQFVTGVKFVVTKDDRISIAVRGSVIYNSEGSFYSSSVGDRWFYPSKINSTDRMNIDISARKNPRDSELIYELSKTGQHYVNLKVSFFSEKSHNAAIVPFLDSRPLETLPPAPISGLGLFYKGKPGYAGFLTLKYFSSQYKRFSRSPIVSIISNMKNYTNGYLVN